MSAAWHSVVGPSLAQGDLLPRCPVPVFPPDYGVSEGTFAVRVDSVDAIVITQSCDLENQKARFVALCPIFTLDELASVEPRIVKPSFRDDIRKGRIEGVHMLMPLVRPEDNSGALVVDFRVIHSLPIDFVTGHAVALGDRWRLQSPYLEHLSQAFARFFMRVGLPAAIPPFK